ncbi:MAG: trypsin-like peptidase domain-containing protein [Proteiniphilum sp.]|jgi:hypothetical protein|nr:trypsin-like peptidase domain-containing protein [Proteiniphilum sp.]
MIPLPHSVRALLTRSILITLWFSFQTITGQISYGGKPLPLHTAAGVRSIAPQGELFVEMTTISNQAALWRSEEDKASFRSLEFAHKFHVFLRPDNSGITFHWEEMKVWRVGIRSKGAYSLNILFSKFRVPEGASVFVYNSDQSEILGSYTHLNNTELNLLPIQPVGGDELIVEYQEPVNAAFKGEIEIGEVNHDFRGIFRAAEPRDPLQGCHPNLLCYPEDIQAGSGVLLLIINGKTLCTGSLVNNSAEDGTPYLLTSTHCLNDDYSAKFLANRKYDLVAGSIVAFFNYNSPLCSTDIRGPLQMTMASADSVLISERHDISLLKFKQAAPKEYQPYFLGWNAGSSPAAPIHGVHHPNGGIKKVAVEEGQLAIGSFDYARYNMEPNAHWSVTSWDKGATEGGSSGSPLLDNEKRILGTLTGGLSTCTSPRGPDLYASFNKFWEVAGSIENPHPISYYLDPINSQFTQLEGFNPYMNAPYTRNQNFREDETAVTTLFQSVPMFATNNTYGYSEFAEEYYAKDLTQLEGVFISSPATNDILNMDIRIRVYSGEGKPERLLHEQPYNYSYEYYSNDHFPVATRDMRHKVENYIAFDNPVAVSGAFYISYYDAKGVPSGFSAFNAEPRKIGSGVVATAWMKHNIGWVRSSENIENPVNTSLLVTPYVMGNKSTSVVPDMEDTEVAVYYSNEVKRIFIESNYELKEWEIYYSSGQKIYQESADMSINRASYFSAHLPNGVYIVKVKTVDGAVAVKKVLVM